MYIYQRNAHDARTCAVQAWNPQEPIPAGWAEVPVHLHNKTLYWKDGGLSEQKPDDMIAEEEFEGTEMDNLKAETIAMIQSLNYSNIDAHLDGITDLPSLKASLKKAYKVILWLVKQFPTG